AVVGLEVRVAHVGADGGSGSAVPDERVGRDVAVVGDGDVGVGEELDLGAVVTDRRRVARVVEFGPVVGEAHARGRVGGAVADEDVGGVVGVVAGEVVGVRRERDVPAVGAD